MSRTPFAFSGLALCKANPGHQSLTNLVFQNDNTRKIPQENRRYKKYPHPKTHGSTVPKFSVYLTSCINAVVLCLGRSCLFTELAIDYPLNVIFGT